MKREPVSIPCLDDALFGWIHWPDPAQEQRDHVAVVCAPIGFEAVHSYRTLRRLADDLAQSGVPTLRFDYPGTGNSPGDDLDPDRVQAWQRGIQAAITFARSTTGRSRICVIGLRMGATLAFEALQEDPSDLLVLWSPVVSGRRYIREAKVVAASTSAGSATPLADGVIDSAGFLISAQTARDLGSLDLSHKTSSPASKTLFLCSNDLEQELPEGMTGSSGIEVKSYSGYAEMMAEPHFTRVPSEALLSIVEWTVRESRVAEPVRPTSQAQRPSDERPCFFGQNQSLFGILTTPKNRLMEKPIVVLPNAGSVHHIGPNRLYVTLARRLAAEGYPSFRFDINGLGESDPHSGPTDNQPYRPLAVEDTREAMQYLARCSGAKTFILMGLCSGAHTAFHTGLKEDKLDISQVVLINPLTFQWREGMSLATASHPIQEVAYYKRAALDPKKWLNALRGRARFFRALKTLISYAGRTVSSIVSTVRGAPTPLSRNLSELFVRGRSLSLVVSRNDPGYSLLTEGAPRYAQRAIADGRIHVSFIDGADHTFSTFGPREDLLKVVSDQLK